MTDENRSYSVKEIDEMIKNHDAYDDFKYTLSDAILFLSYAHNKPIKGKIKQMKEVFLLLNDVLKNISVQRVYFEKHRFGPYSEEVEHIIDHLVSSNYLSVSGRKTSKDFAIKITPKGMEYIKTKYRELPTNIQELLKRKRLEWDTHTPKGIMNVVYTYYPDFKEKSIVKRRYADLDWKNDNQTQTEIKR